MSTPQPAVKPSAWYNYPYYTEAIGDGQSIGTPFHTPVTAPYSGTVTRSNYGQTGGQVDVTMPDGSSYSFVHLDVIDGSVKPGAKVQPGQFVGLSGGENPGYPGAQHPATPQYSTGPHIDFDVWTAGAWNSTPQPTIAKQALNSLRSGGIVGGGPGNVKPSTTLAGASVKNATTATDCGDFPWLGSVKDKAAWVLCKTSSIGADVAANNPLTGIANALGTMVAFLGEISTWVFNPIRIIKLFSGLSLIILSLGIAFLPDLAAAATAGAGYPEFSGAARGIAGGKVKQGTGAAIRQTGTSIIGGQRTREREATKQQRAYTAASANEGERLRREATTRNLKQQNDAMRAARVPNTIHFKRAAPTTAKLTPTTPPAGRGGVAKQPPNRWQNPNPYVIGRTGLINNAQVARQAKANKQSQTPAKESQLSKSMTSDKGSKIFKAPTEYMEDLRKTANNPKVNYDAKPASKPISYDEQQYRRNWVRRWLRKIARTRPEGV